MAKIPPFKWSKLDELINLENFSDDFSMDKIIEFLGNFYSPDLAKKLLGKAVDEAKEIFDELIDYYNGQNSSILISEDLQETFSEFINDTQPEESIKLISNNELDASNISFGGTNSELMPISLDDFGLNAGDVSESMDAVEGVEMVENASDGLDLLTSAEPVLFVVGIIASVGVGYIFKNLHKKKKEQLNKLIEVTNPKLKFIEMMKDSTSVEQAYETYKELKSKGEF